MHIRALSEPHQRDYCDRGMTLSEAPDIEGLTVTHKNHNHMTLNTEPSSPFETFGRPLSGSYSFWSDKNSLHVIIPTELFEPVLEVLTHRTLTKHAAIYDIDHSV